MMPLLIAVIGHFHLWFDRWKRRMLTTLATIAAMAIGTPIHGPTPVPNPMIGNTQGIST